MMANKAHMLGYELSNSSLFRRRKEMDKQTYEECRYMITSNEVQCSFLCWITVFWHVQGTLS